MSDIVQRLKSLNVSLLDNSANEVIYQISATQLNEVIDEIENLRIQFEKMYELSTRQIDKINEATDKIGTQYGEIRMLKDEMHQLRCVMTEIYNKTCKGKTSDIEHIHNLAIKGLTEAPKETKS